jgi:hypothetical protein
VTNYEQKINSFIVNQDLAPMEALILVEQLISEL